MVKDMGDLTGRVAIVTGAAGGIGRAVCETLAMHGAIIAGADMNQEGLNETIRLVEEAGGQMSGFPLNVMELSSVQEMMKSVDEKYGHIDILVNVAGILSGARYDEVTTEMWDKMIDINLRGYHYCNQSVVPYMAKNGGGSVVSISSQAKGGILALTKGYARQTQQYHIRFNDVAPGRMLTPMTAARGDKPEGIPVGRLGTAQDVANAVYFLASDLSGHINGMALRIDGGKVAMA